MKSERSLRSPWLSLGTVTHVLLLLIACGGGSMAQVPLSSFHPYGTAARDLTLPAADDASTRIPINFEYPFFGSTFREVHVSTNGLISFGSITATYVPSPFPLNHTKAIATYWTDSHPGRGGNVFYREIDDPEAMLAITAEIRSRFIELHYYVSRWALVVTFDNVPAYGCGGGSTAACKSPCDRTVTHQTILSSNGVQSFVIFNFNKLQYTVGTASCNAHAQVGFNAGDGKRFYLLASSNTADISRVAVTDSNVGIAGKWMFSTNRVDISEGCNSDGLLEIQPRKLLYFGHQKILLSGPCFKEHNVTLTVIFESTSVECTVNDASQVECLAPFFNKLGRNEILLSYNAVDYKTFVVVVGSEDNLVLDAKVTAQSPLNDNGEYTINWEANDEESSANISFKGFQKDYLIDEAGNIVATEIVPLDYGELANNGTATLRPASTSRVRRSSNVAGIIKQILLSGTVGNTNTFPIVETVVLSDKANVTAHCLNWYKNQPSTEQMRQIVEEVQERSPCHPGVPEGYPKTHPLGNFVIDDSCSPPPKRSNRIEPRLCSFFHIGATACYRSTNNAGGPVSECCYDGSRTLILGPPGGGTLDFADATVSVDEHFLQDVLPYITCCKFGLVDHCDKYYEKRPSIEPAKIRPRRSPVVDGRGDPHFTTLDGTSYTFNPVGEFVYFTTGEDEIQARISQFVDKRGNSKDACYFAGFVVKSNDSDVAQVELSNRGSFEFRINGQPVSLDLGLWSFHGIRVDYLDNVSLVIQTESGIRVEMHISSSILHIILSLPEKMKGKVQGLVGNWDDNPTNDLELPDGSWIPSNSSARDIHHDFGMKWSTTNDSSLFSYPKGLTWFDYQNPSFTPSFLIPPINPACGDDVDCRYDAMVTGDVSVGLSNVAIKKRAAEIDRVNEEIIRYCPLNASVLHGTVRVESEKNNTAARYHVRCDEGFRLRGSSEATCVDGSPPHLATCEKLPETTYEILPETTNENPPEKTNAATTMTSPARAVMMTSIALFVAAAQKVVQILYSD